MLAVLLDERQCRSPDEQITSARLRHCMLLEGRRAGLWKPMIVDVVDQHTVAGRTVSHVSQDLPRLHGAAAMGISISPESLRRLPLDSLKFVPYGIPRLRRPRGSPSARRIDSLIAT